MSRSRGVYPFIRLRPLDKPSAQPYFFLVPDTATPVVQPGSDTETQSQRDREPGYLVVCWNDPVNFMDYVTHVFQKVFGWTRQKAEFHMRQVHNEGRSVLVREGLERAEFYVHQLQKYTLHATLERDA